MRTTLLSGDKRETVKETAKSEDFAPEFHGQQTGETLLYRVKQNRIMEYLSIAGVVIGGLALLAVLQFLGLFFGSLFTLVQIGGTMVGLTLMAVIVWWLHKSYTETEMYVTDRRLVKLAPAGPFRKTMRTIFWADAIKVKTYYQNPLLERIMGIGSVEVEGRHEGDNINMEHLTYHDDLGHYLDKILYVAKNTPEELKAVRKFVPKPKGQRY